MYRFTADGLEALESSSSAQLMAASASQQQSGPEAKPRSSYLYELQGVVVHSGTAFAGHYYSYIKERPQAPQAGQQVGHGEGGGDGQGGRRRGGGGKGQGGGGVEVGQQVCRPSMVN